MKEYLKQNANRIITIFLILQPIIDVITSLFLNVLHLEVTFGLIIRMLFLIGIVIYNWCILKSDKRSLIYTAVVGIFIFFFMGNVYLTKGIDACFYELKNIMRYFYFPLLLINLHSINKNASIQISKKTLINIYWIYLLLIIIPMITHTDFTGYFEGKVGTIGWFNSTNEIGAILSGLLPLIFIKGQAIKKNILLIIITVIVFFSLGSKVTIFSLLITGIFYGIRFLKNTKNKKKVCKVAVPLLIIIMVITALLLPKTNFYKNIQIHLDFLEVDNVIDIFKEEKLIDHFIFSSRLTFLENTRTSYIESPLSSKFLGVGFIENYGTDNVNLKTIEMDIFDIFYRTGIIGFLLYLVPIYIVLKERIRKKSAEERLSIAILIFISCMAGHVLTSPAVSIYLTVLLLNILKEDEVCKLES